MSKLELLKCQAEIWSLKNRIKIAEKELEEERKKVKLAELVESLQGKVLRPQIGDD